MGPRPLFWRRDFLGPLGKIMGARFDVRSMTWDENGGPLAAEIEVNASEHALWDLFDLLRCPIDIVDHAGYCWWGMVYEVKIITGGVGVTLSLDPMYNRVAVAYSYVGPGTNTVGVRKTTAWGEDAQSLAVYGTKEYLSSQSGMTDAAATAQRDAILANSSKPVGAPDLGGRGAPTAIIRCKGWWETMKWKYAPVAATVSVSYQTLGAHEQIVGSQNGNVRCMQQFTVGDSNISVVQLAVRAKKVGNPTDNLAIAVYALDGPNGNPAGSALASASVAGGQMSTAFEWHQPTCNEKELTAVTMYGLQVSRSGSVDPANYFAVNVNQATGYTGGVFRVYNSTSWGDRAPAADMLFRILSNPQVQTTTQIASLVAAYGQFLIGTVIINASGITQGSFRSGDKTARAEIDGLLKAGTTNGRRLFVWITRDRKVVITEEPSRNDYPHFSIDHRGQLYEDGGRYMRLIPPIGKWVRVLGRPRSGGVTAAEQQLISGGTWTPESGLQVHTFGRRGPQDFLKVQE